MKQNLCNEDFSLGISVIASFSCAIAWPWAFPSYRKEATVRPHHFAITLVNDESFDSSKRDKCKFPQKHHRNRPQSGG